MQTAHAAPVVVFVDGFVDGDVRVPLGILDLESFRRWLWSDDFPEKGRIDYLDGDMEIDMSPEELTTHGAAKTEVAAQLHLEAKARDLGHVFIDSTRITCPAANLSVEPDVVLILHETLESGRARLVSKGDPERCIEVEGPVDLVVEVVSKSSTRKDRVRLKQLYFAAGIPEYWIVDARRPEVELTVLERGEGEYVAAARDGEGFALSRVLGRAVRLDRHAGRGPLPRYELVLR